MNWTLTFSPLVPVEAVLGFAAVGLVLVLFALFRRVRGSWVRAGALVALLLALANPIVLNEEREPLSTVVAVVVDESASQTLDGRDRMTAEIRKALEDRLGDFRQVEVRTVVGGGNVGGRPADGTQLFAPLGATLADIPPDRLGAVIMLTDGQVHDVPERPSEIIAGAPLHVLLSGRENERDRRIVIDKAPRFGIVGEDQTITYRVLDEGPGAARGDVNVTVTLDGEPFRSERVRPGATAELTFEVPHGGPNVIQFEAEPMTGELTPINNRAVVEIQGIRENLRVLLVSGEPHAGERTWRNLLKSDAAVDLVHFTILRPPEKQDGTPINQLSLIAFPTRELFSVKIDEFDLIIFDRYQRRGILPIIYFDNIARFVKKGGALLVAGGPDYASATSLYRTPLADVLPAAPTGRTIEEPFKPGITKTGERHPVTRDLAPEEATAPDWGRWFRLVDVDPPSGQVVMNGPQDKPLLVLNRAGEGRVALLLSDHAWLWARGFEGGGPHVDLLRRLGHWLMKEPDLEEEALRAAFRGGMLEIERQTLSDSIGPVTLRAPSGAEQQLNLTEAEPGLWRGRITAGELGLWRATEGGHTAFAAVGPANPREFLDVRSTRDKLNPAVGESGGRIIRMADSSGDVSLPRIVPIRAGSTFGGSDWLGIRMTEASVLRGVDRFSLFGGFLGLALLMGAFAATWFREGR